MKARSPLRARAFPALPALLALLAHFSHLSGTCPRAASPESEEYRDPAADAAALAAADSAAARAAAARDSLLADSLARAAAQPGAPALPHPVLVPGPGPGGGPVARPTLVLLPTAAAAATAARGAGGPEREAVSEALRLGAEQAGRHRVLSLEATARSFGPRARVPGNCFGERCALAAARKTGAEFVLVSGLSRTRPGEVRPQAGPVAELALALVETRTGKVRRAARARACPGPESLIPFAQQAAWHLLLAADPGTAAAGEALRADTPSTADADPAPAASASSAAPAPAAPAPAGCGLIADIVLDSGAWAEIPWLNARDTADLRRHWAWAGAGMLAAGLGMAWAQGQLLQEDRNPAAPSGPLLPGDGASSWLRGFFAAPNLGARHAALGGAGIAHAGDALAALLNPAGVADAWRENAVAARRGLPGGAPSFNLAYAGPLKGGWYQGLAVQHEGDDLANETTLQAALAADWAGLSTALAGIKTGAALKAYLAKVGAEGAGLDRSTGHSVGLGLDLGFKARLTDRITGAVSVRDAAGFLRHANTFTGGIEWEWLPPEYRVGAAYQAGPATLLLLDGQKGLVADQADHVRLGGERVLFGFLALRAGLHQAYGRETVRTLATGFGIDSEGMSDRPQRSRIAINYAYEFGMDEDAPLGAGQSFSLNVSW